MQTALDARNRGQLAGLFTDLPPRRTRLLARFKAALRGDFTSDARAQADRDSAGPQPLQASRRVPGADMDAARAGQGHGGQAAYAGRPGLPGAPGSFGGPGRAGGQPVPLFFPPGRSDRYTIGRTRECDLCLTDLSVSRLHAELLRDESGWLLNDLGSHNGTRLNGWLVRETVRVRAGDRLEFGSMAFIIADNPHEAAPAQ